MLALKLLVIPCCKIWWIKRLLWNSQLMLCMLMLIIFVNYSQIPFKVIRFFINPYRGCCTILLLLYWVKFNEWIKSFWRRPFSVKDLGILQILWFLWCRLQVTKRTPWISLFGNWLRNFRKQMHPLHVGCVWSWEVEVWLVRYEFEVNCSVNLWINLLNTRDNENT